MRPRIGALSALVLGALASGCAGPAVVPGAAHTSQETASASDNPDPTPHSKLDLTPPPAYAPTPCLVATTPYAQPILVTGQGTPLGSAINFTADSSWAGEVGLGGPFDAVWAGYKPTDADAFGTPAVLVYREHAMPGSCSQQLVLIGMYQASAADGPFVIDRVADGRLYLSTPSRRHWTFSLTTYRFSG